MKSLVFKLLVGIVETLYMVIGGVAMLFVFIALNSGFMELPASPLLGILGALFTMLVFMVPGYLVFRFLQNRGGKPPINFNR